MFRAAFLIAALVAGSAPAIAQDGQPLIEREHAAAIAAELSGAATKRTVHSIAQHHRMRGSQGYRAAAELILERLKSAGLQQAQLIALPADGKIFYGTQRSRPAWNATFAELWEQRQDAGRWADTERVASWADQPISLAQDSVSGLAEGELVDVGAGTSAADYAGKDVRGKLVLVSSQPEDAAALAVTRHGAAGIVSWAQNQKQAWWGEDESLVRWGHLSSWTDPAFAFMVSPARARAWQQRLQSGQTVRLRARVEAGRSQGQYLIPTAVIPGRNPDQEIVFSCHLDHPSPGANDDASGCAGILEIARALNRLIADGRLPQPQRSIRFIWPCEIECTIALLSARPEFARRTLATIHLDMIGGDTEKTKSILRVHGSPPSLPSFVSDVGFAVARWVNDQSLAYADTGSSDWPLLDPEGDKRALQAVVGGFSEGSDHTVWVGSSWSIPILYIADWPDRYIHTQRDVPENLDATKLKRAIFIAAASAWYLANLGPPETAMLQRVMASEMAVRRAEMLRRAAFLDEGEAAILMRHRDSAEAAEARSLGRFGLTWSGTAPAADFALEARSSTGPVYRRKPAPLGPMDGFGYSWFDDHLKQAGLPRPVLLDRTAPRDGPSFAFEALNLVDGRRSIDDIREHLFATVGPVPVAEVTDYLATLERLGILERS